MLRPKNLLDIRTVKDELSEPTEGGTKSDWELVSFDEYSIGVKINFANPLLVSTGVEPDLLLMQIDLSVLRDEFGNPLPGSVLKTA